MVSASDSQSGGPGFESRSGHLQMPLAGFVLGRQLVGVFNPVFNMLYLNYLFLRI